MSNEEILQIALRQSAVDCSCAPEDFLCAERCRSTARLDEREVGEKRAPFRSAFFCVGINPFSPA